jgi:hypothetical protein
LIYWYNFTGESRWKNKNKRNPFGKKARATKMKKKLHKEIFLIGSEKIEFHTLRFYQVASIVTVAFLAVLAGTLYGIMIFS